jgi:hypothetical protein
MLRIGPRRLAGKVHLTPPAGKDHIVPRPETLKKCAFTRRSSFYLAAMFGLAYGKVMPLFAILGAGVFPARIMGAVLGAETMASTFGSLGQRPGIWVVPTLIAPDGGTGRANKRPVCHPVG